MYAGSWAILASIMSLKRSYKRQLSMRTMQTNCSVLDDHNGFLCLEKKSLKMRPGLFFSLLVSLPCGIQRSALCSYWSANGLVVKTDAREDNWLSIFAVGGMRIQRCPLWYSTCDHMLMQALWYKIPTGLLSPASVTWFVVLWLSVSFFFFFRVSSGHIWSSGWSVISRAYWVWFGSCTHKHCRYAPVLT